MQIESLDHFVLTVHDITITCTFYTQVLGMQVVTFGDNRKALQFGKQKLNLHQVGKEFEPKALRPTAGSADVCFITRTPLTQVIEQLKVSNVDIVEGPVQKIGAIGILNSVYIRDPDGNLIEISNYIDA